MEPSDLPLRIFANAAFGRGPARPARRETEARRPELAPPSIENGVHAEVARILQDVPAPDESVQRAFDRKERELRGLFSSLSRAESRELQATLDADRDSNRGPLARLASERRDRVLACLAEIARGKGGGR